jgi:ArsR family transcriptional regulator, virulence genes transcriptional regulator
MYKQVFKLHTDFLKSLAHPKRLEIIHLLRDQSLSVFDIQNMLDLPQANLSQHLQILREHGVVTSYKKGKQIFYQISDPKTIIACDLLREVLVKQHTNSKIKKDLQDSLSDIIPTFIDPICGMKLCKKTAAFSLKTKDGIKYFCASGCLKSFKKNMLKS